MNTEIIPEAIHTLFDAKLIHVGDTTIATWIKLLATLKTDEKTILSAIHTLIWSNEKDITIDKLKNLIFKITPEKEILNLCWSEIIKYSKDEDLRLSEDIRKILDDSGYSCGDISKSNSYELSAIKETFATHLKKWRDENRRDPIYKCEKRLPELKDETFGEKPVDEEIFKTNFDKIKNSMKERKITLSQETLNNLGLKDEMLF